MNKNIGDMNKEELYELCNELLDKYTDYILLQRRKDKAIEYIKEHKKYGVYMVNGNDLLEILGDKEIPKGFKSYKDYKKKEEAIVNHFCKGDKENE